MRLTVGRALVRWLPIVAFLGLLVLPALSAAVYPAGAPSEAPPATEESTIKTYEKAVYADNSFLVPPFDMSFAEWMKVDPSEYSPAVDREFLRDAGFYKTSLLESSAAGPSDDEPYPELVFRDSYTHCDLNGDDVNDIVFNELPLAYGRPHLRAVDGTTGETIWYDYGLPYTRLLAFRPNVHRPAPALGYHAPMRPGLPQPIFPFAPENAIPAGDVNNDGVCDFMIWGHQPPPFRSVLPLLGIWFYIDWDIKMVDGATGRPIWTMRIVADRFDSGGSEIYWIKNYPTGFMAYPTPSGPKFLLKTTDAHYSSRTGRYQVYENLTLFNASNRQVFWKGQLPQADSGAPPVAAWFSGVSQLAGDDEPDIVLDRARYFTQDVGALQIIAVRGDVGAQGGTILWGPRGYYEPPHTGQLSLSEEVNEAFLWKNVQIVGDTNGDGAGEIIPTYFQIVVGNGNPINPGPSEATTINGLFRTHIQPYYGNNGTRLWNQKDLKFQGWGFPASVNPPTAASNSSFTYDPFTGPHWLSPRDTGKEEARPYFAFGTIDPPTRPLPGGRFPPKEIRMLVVKTEDGSPTWGSYLDKMGLDSYLSYDLALWQYLRALAPHDYDGDGIKDLVSLPHYIEPEGSLQILLASARHDYRIVHSITGKPIRTLTAWGPTGQVLKCDNEPADGLTVLSGYAKRYDLIRISAKDSTPLWRQPLHNNPTPQAQTAGIELIAVSARCTDHNTTTAFGTNLYLYSLKRNYEVITPYGHLNNDNDTLGFIWPKLRGNPPKDGLLNISYLLDHPDLPPTTQQKLVNTLGPLAPGVAIGLGVNWLVFRRRGGVA